MAVNAGEEERGGGAQTAPDATDETQPLTAMSAHPRPLQTFAAFAAAVEASANAPLEDDPATALAAQRQAYQDTLDADAGSGVAASLESAAAAGAATMDTAARQKGNAAAASRLSVHDADVVEAARAIAGGWSMVDHATDVLAAGWVQSVRSNARISRTGCRRRAPPPPSELSHRSALTKQRVG